MFTDIEGSTSLLQQVGDAYDTILLRHQHILREEIAHHGGTEVSTSGDSLFALFRSCGDGLAATIAMQRRLAREPWQDGVSVRVRMGLHHGYINVLEGECTGLDVHRAARICAAGHGGQILLSREVLEALGPVPDIPDGISLRDLGRHRLKDLRFPEALSDIVDSSLDSVFPALRSLETRTNNLAHHRDVLVGRDTETASLLDLLESHPGRLVTILGVGGLGKTALAEHVAGQCLQTFRDGVFMVGLDGVQDPNLVAASIAQAVQIPNYSSRPLEDDIAAAFRSDRVLLVLDSFEHLLDATPMLVRLLAKAPNLRILVTSQAALGVAAERIHELEPLDLPTDDTARGDKAAAVRLLVSEVAIFDPGFCVTDDNRSAIFRIVRRLEGVPLALEIAAAQLRFQSPDEMLVRLESKARKLKSARRDVTRHRSLHDAIAWSEQLLDEAERDALQRLSVFAGGFTFGDAEAVLERTCDDIDVLEIVSALMSRSLLRRRSVNGAPRFSMFNMVREQAFEGLEARGLADEMTGQHIRLYSDLARRHGGRVLSSEQRRHVTRLTEEVDNLRAAMRRSLATEAIEPLGAIIDGLYWYWISHGLFSEAFRWLDQATALADRLPASPGGAAIHTAAAYVRAIAGDYGGAYDHGRSAEEASVSLGDEVGAARAGIIHAVGAVATGRTEDPSEPLARAMARLEAAGDVFFHGLGLTIVGELNRMGGARDVAEAAYLAGMEQFERDDCTFWQGGLNSNIGYMRLAARDADAAAARFGRALGIAVDYNYSLVGTVAVAGLAGVAAQRGDAETCLKLLAAVSVHRDQIGAKFEPTDQADIDLFATSAAEAVGATRAAELAVAGQALGWMGARAVAQAIAAA